MAERQSKNNNNNNHTNDDCNSHKLIITLYLFFYFLLIYLFIIYEFDIILSQFALPLVILHASTDYPNYYYGTGHSICSH